MKHTIWSKPFYYVFAFLVASISIYPILLMILSSFKTSAEIFTSPLAFPQS
ncbi:sugar ABC transporter permease, partial [Halobacillus sp. BBL2006]